jgi:hypothetical protein
MTRAALLAMAEAMAKMARFTQWEDNHLIYTARAELAAWHASRQPDSVRT